MSRIPHRHGPPPPLGVKPPQSRMFGRNNDLRFSLRIAEITRVDYENMVCDLAFLQGDSPPAEEVPLTAAYWSQRTFLGAMPEKGAICIVGFTATHQDRATSPFILTFLPNGFKTALRFDPFGVAPRNAEELEVPQDVAVTELEGIYGPIRRKMRKLYPGMLYGMSEQGAEIILDSGVHLLSREGSEFQLRSDDSSGILTTMDMYTTTAAGRSRSGRIIRNALNVPSDFLNPDGVFPEEHPMFGDLVEAGLLFEDGTLVSDINSFPNIILPDGRRVSIITENLRDPNDITTAAYTEKRSEIQEFSDGMMPSGDAQGFDADVIAPDSHYDPFIETVLGTVVGNDPYSSGGRSRYGQLLRPSLFSTPNATEGRPHLEPVENSESENEKSTVAAGLYRMNRPDGLGELFLSHDKEGHVFLSIPASTSKSKNLGAGRSLEADLKGSTKMVMGAEKQDNISMDLHTKGGLKWSLGSSSAMQRSLDIKARGGVSLDIRNPDSNGIAVDMAMEGDFGVGIEGSYGISTTGDNLEEVGGFKKMASDSLSVEVGQGNYTTTVLSDQETTITGEKTMSIGEGRETTILTGGESTSIKSGDSIVSFTAPSSREITFLSSGTHSITSNGSLNLNRSSSISANYSFEAPSGSYSVNLSTGSINLRAGVSSIEVSASGIDVRGPQINLVGEVSLGTSAAPNAVIGGVAGPSPHIDHMTGRLLNGNPIVKTM